MEIVWSGEEVAEYDVLRKEADKSGLKPSDWFKARLKKR